MSKDRIEKPEDAFSVGQEVRVKIIKLDAVEKKIGLSIKAVQGDEDTATIRSYRDQYGDGSATLGDLASAEVLRKSSAAMQQPGDEDDETGSEESPETDD